MRATIHERGNGSPKPHEIRAAREAAGLSREQAARLIYKSRRSWEKWENGERDMDPAFWHLFRILSSEDVSVL